MRKLVLAIGLMMTGLGVWTVAAAVPRIPTPSTATSTTTSPAAATSPLFADSIDGAEAKRRGVSVETVQLEHAKERISTLEKQVAELQAKNAELQKKISAVPATASAASRPASQPAVGSTIAKAISDHKLVKGMTVAEAEKALGVTLILFSDSSEGTTYKAGVTDKVKPAPSSGAQYTGTEYTITIVNGLISNWSSRPFFIGNDGQSHYMQ